MRRDPHLRSVVVEATSDEVPFVRLDVEAGTTAAVEHLLPSATAGSVTSAPDVDEETFRGRRRALAATLRAAGEDPADHPSAAADVGFADRARRRAGAARRPDPGRRRCCATTT